LLKNLAERYPDFVLESAELNSRIHAVAKHLDAGREEALAKHGLSPGKLYVMAFLLNEEMMGHERPRASEIADGLGVTPATITGLLDGLERDGFIERRPHRQDRRALAIEMTNKSRRFLDEYLPVQARQVHASFSRLTEAEKKTLKALLEKIVPPRSD
jgi:DNA-binding MarR family transcriptional regulator